ncbi:MAG TPA: AAA family ATPase, partial [Planctomycetota bacterium]|nr:AAA family ATPase [Planctomycetota bacterium]
RRTAPDVYLGVKPIFRDGRGHSMTRAGDTVDYAVHMRRLPDDRSALSLVRSGRLEHADIDRVARRIAEFYAGAPVRRSADSLEGNIRENFEQAAPYIGRFVDNALFRETRDAQEAWLSANRARLEKRESRDGHGDLRLEHVYFMPDGVRVIDCIEFAERFRVADPALDAAFFAMDLRANGREDLAEHFFARFAYESDDYDFYPLADGYVSYRAWVRGKVACFVAAERPAGDRKAREAARFFELARDAMRPRTPTRRLVAVGGIVGTGKTTVAEALGRRLSSPVIVADATRKHLAGLPHDARGPDRIYTREFTGRVQDELFRRAEQVLAGGRPAILDTTFAARDLRLRARQFACDRAARFHFVECSAPEAIARERLRRREGGVSDAREDLYALIASSFEPVTELAPAEHIPVDTTKPLEGILEYITERLR